MFSIYITILIGNQLKVSFTHKIIIIMTVAFLFANSASIFKKIILYRSDIQITNDSQYQEITSYGLQGLEDTHYFNIMELGHGEYLPLTDTYKYSQASTNIIFADESVYVWDFNRVGTTITFNSNYDYSDTVYMPLSYYKGYYYQELDYNGNVLKESPCSYSVYNKRVGVDIEPGSRIYRVFYKGTFIQKISNIISLGALIFLLIKFALFRGWHFNNSHNKTMF